MAEKVINRLCSTRSVELCGKIQKNNARTYMKGEKCEPKKLVFRRVE
jgi:hypothetical protein